jgi:hypothetical protein
VTNRTGNALKLAIRIHERVQKIRFTVCATATLAYALLAVAVDSDELLMAPILVLLTVVAVVGS